MGDMDTACHQDLLKPYYDRLFPTKLMYDWLSYGSDDVFSRREFSFTLSGDVYLRYQSFSSAEEFGKELKRRLPEKIDIGAVYSQKPKMKETSSGFQPVEKEFVVDIDLTDYEDVRTCCTGAKVCDKCWKFLSLAVKILDASLREDFGFNHLLWVYSGRRGVHCWVSDEVARKLDTAARSAVIEYLTVIRGGENQAKKVSIPVPERIHPLLRRSIEVIEEEYFEICGDDQDVFSIEKNFNMLPDDVKAASRNPLTRFQDVMKYIQENKKNKKTCEKLALELPLQFCYPRLDVNVSKGLNHLLKSPFCIHPKTGQVCVPFDPHKVDEFVTKEVPTITQLMDQMVEYDKSNSNSSTPVPDYKKTEMEKYIGIFENFVDALQNNKKNDGKRNSKENRKAKKTKHEAIDDF